MHHLPADMRRRSAGWAIGAVTGLLWCLAPASADSEFACVRCTGPDQTYRCKAMSDDPVPAQALGYFCMTQIAREHTHDSCAVVRSAAAQCSGQDVTYVYQDQIGDDRPAIAGQSEPPPAGNVPPATVADMTKGTVDSAAAAGKAVGDATVKAGKAVGDATVKAGQAVGDATKRTLKCLGSALNDC
jgi:hypothetical protein